MTTQIPYDAVRVAALRARHDAGEVVGLQDVSGIRPRLDIDLFLATEPTCFNLFLLAMQDLQQDPEVMKTPMGYFEIAGIHGLPKRAWQGVPDPKKTGHRVATTAMGYCEHSSFKFPTWHRPYLMMLEQALYLQMIKRAQTFPDDQIEDQLEAAQKFRLPYWDYFRPRDYETTFPGVTSGLGFTTFPYDFSVPQVLTIENVIVAEPKNGKVSKRYIANPLRTYNFPLENGLVETDWNLLSSKESAYYARFAKGHTVRHGLRYFIEEGEEEDNPKLPKEQYLNQALKNKNRNTRASQQGNTENLSLIVNKARAQTLTNMRDMILSKSAPFEGYKSYENFATNRQAPGGDAGLGGNVDQPYGSLEDFHNGWHGNIGGSVGHMGHPGIAAFDPIFWFHHANIDRYLAVWQEVNPDAWFNERPQLLGDQLLPFVSDAPGNTEGFWTSQMVRDTHDLGYEYPDIVKGNVEETVRRFEEQELWSVSEGTGKAPADKMPLDLSNTITFGAHPEYLPPYTDKPSVPVVNQPIRAAKMAPQHIMALSRATVEKVTETVVDQNTKSDADTVPSDDGTNLNTIDFDAFLPMEGSEIPVDWYIDVEVDRLALNGPFTIYYFIGDAGGAINIKPADYAIAPTLAGVFYNFASPIEACDNCGDHAEQQLKITGTTNISHMLKDYVINDSRSPQAKGLKSLQPEDVVPFLQDRLRWRIMDSRGVKSDPRLLTGDHGLKLIVNSVRYVNDGGVTKPDIAAYPKVISTIIGTPSAKQPMTNDIAVGIFKS